MAVLAITAVGIRKHDRVARPKLSNSRAYLLNDPRPLMPQNGRQLEPKRLIERAQIRMAQTATDDANQHLPLPRCVDLDLFDFERTRATDDRCGGNRH